MTNIFNKILGRREQSHRLSIPREEESEHILILGDSGSGKSQLIHRFLYEIATREKAEAAVIYDPACDFAKGHFNARRGDLIVNPLDIRFPFWSPGFEISQPTDRYLIAESFFPGREDQRGSNNEFFNETSRDVFARMLEFSPTPQQLVSWLQAEDEIDRLVEGTELAAYISPTAPNQRGGVIGNLNRIGKTLRLLPAQNQCTGNLSLTEWARKRRGWIFLTSTQDTRSALRPLTAAFLDILMKRLMSVAPEWGRANPCWVIADEVHSLKRLPALHTGLVEGRKYGLKIVQGTQGKSEYEAEYGPKFKTMLAQAHLKIFLRCNEADSAEWIAKTIGEEERERPRVGTTASVQDAGRDSMNYSSITERRAVFSKEEIMALPNLEGFWKYGDRAVGFRIPYLPIQQVAHDYLPRKWNDNETPISALNSKQTMIDNNALSEERRTQSDDRNFPTENVTSKLNKDSENFKKEDETVVTVASNNGSRGKSSGPIVRSTSNDPREEIVLKPKRQQKKRELIKDNSEELDPNSY